jgi:signal transduction histidine kinase
MSRRSLLVYLSLLGVWSLVVIWQVEEHQRMGDYARANLRNRSRDIANTLGSFIRAQEFRGVLFSPRFQIVLDDLVNGRTNELVTSSEVLLVVVLNTADERLAWAGSLAYLDQTDLHEKRERWGLHSLTVAYPILGSVTEQGATNPAAPVLIDPPTNGMGGRFPRRDERRPEMDPPPGPPPDGDSNRPPPQHSGPRERDGHGEGEPRSRLPFWARGMSEAEYHALSQKRELHGLVITLSADSYLAVLSNDLRQRWLVAFFAALSVIGSGLAWRNLTKASDLQIRLVRASELNSHLKEMNLAAAGLAHETRNPLNIIRGLAHMISKQPDAPVETRQRTHDIINEADKVAAQLNEFINYSRPREVRRARLALGSIINEVVRTLGYDIEEKKIGVQVKGDPVIVEADEQLLRQALFNLLLNAIQAVSPGGEIQVATERRGATEAVLEVRDNGPGVPLENRTEIFKPYFTTQKTGTGLGLAVVQQIVLAHGWEIQCLPNEPKGALFRLSHLKVAA